MHVHICAGVHRGQEKVSDVLELELQVVLATRDECRDLKPGLPEDLLVF